MSKPPMKGPGGRGPAGPRPKVKKETLPRTLKLLYTFYPKLIPVVDAITPDILALAGGAGSTLGTGGMATKLRAAQIAMEAGVDMVITNGETPEVLYDLFDGKAVGTRFLGGVRV